MQTVFAYVGDAVSAAGFRLAGARTFSPSPGEEAGALAQARRVADLVLVSDEVAAALPRTELNALLTTLQPLVAIVPRPGEALSARDPAERVRAQLGLEQQS
jgi:vacuolar-type H+-ATPase subunit F/Vma7